MFFIGEATSSYKSYRIFPYAEEKFSIFHSFGFVKGC